MPRGVDRYDEALLQGRLWTPAILRNNAQLLRWYDAEYGPFTVPATTSISQWDDISGLANHLTQPTSGNRPTRGAKRVEFPTDASINFPVFAIPTLPTGGWDMAMVGIPNSAAAYRSMLHSHPTDNHQLLIEITTNVLGTFDGSMRQAGTLTWPPQLGLMYGSWRTTTDIRMSRDGGPLASTSGGTVSLASTLFGSSVFASQSFGTVYEVVITSPNLPDAVKKRLEGYLAWKWTRLGIGDVVGLLPGTHPFKNRPPLIGD